MSRTAEEAVGGESLRTMFVPPAELASLQASPVTYLVRSVCGFTNGSLINEQAMCLIDESAAAWSFLRAVERSGSGACTSHAMKSAPYAKMPHNFLLQ